MNAHPVGLGAILGALALAGRTAAGIAAVALAGLAAAASPATASAQADTLRVDLTQARRMGLESSPFMAQARGALEAALGARSQMRGYAFNPQLEVKAPSYLDPGDHAPFEGILTQELELAGQWGLRRSVADRRAEAAEAGLRDAERTVGLSAELAWLRAAAAAQRHEVLARGAAMSEELLRAVVAEHKEGKISLLELNLARIASGRGRADERAAWRAWAAASTELAGALGLHAETPIALPPEGAPPGAAAPTLAESPTAELLQRALAARPDLAAARAGMDAAVSARRLAARQMIPNLRLAAVATRSLAGEPVRWGLRVGIPIPLWNRGGGAARQASGEEEMARASYAITELTVRAEVAAAAEAYRAAHEELALYAADVLEPARQNASLLQAAYAEGRLDLTTTLLLQTQLLQGELGYWDAWLAERSARARLAAAVGGSPERKP